MSAGKDSQIQLKISPTNKRSAPVPVKSHNGDSNKKMKSEGPIVRDSVIVMRELRFDKPTGPLAAFVCMNSFIGKDDIQGHGFPVNGYLKLEDVRQSATNFIDPVAEGHYVSTNDPDEKHATDLSHFLLLSNVEKKAFGIYDNFKAMNLVTMYGYNEVRNVTNYHEIPAAYKERQEELNNSAHNLKQLLNSKCLASKESPVSTLYHYLNRYKFVHQVRFVPKSMEKMIERLTSLANGVKRPPRYTVDEPSVFIDPTEDHSPEVKPLQNTADKVLTYPTPEK